jgi:hypothetical protein
VVIRLLPERDGELSYQIKGLNGSQDRVTVESSDGDGMSVGDNPNITTWKEDPTSEGRALSLVPEGRVLLLSE